eukprot:tig00000555_g2133.t1
MGSFTYGLVKLGLGTVAPGWQAFKAVRANDAAAKEAYLIFFIVFSVFCCIEWVLDLFVSFLPFYWELKTVAVIWLAQYQGAQTLYNSYLGPLLQQNEAKIEKAVIEGKQKAAAKAKEYGVVVANAVRKHTGELVVKGQQILLTQLANAQNANLQRRTAPRNSAAAAAQGAAPAAQAAAPSEGQDRS